MPQRTKKEKQAAKQRRALKYTIVESASPVVKEHTQEKTSRKHEVTVEEVETKNYFLQDLRKSALFIVVILGLEIFLHFARISNYFTK
jgi:uncharacterized protein YktB (UPF0637 family)